MAVKSDRMVGAKDIQFNESLRLPSGNGLLWEGMEELNVEEEEEEVVEELEENEFFIPSQV